VKVNEGELPMMPINQRARRRGQFCWLHRFCSTPGNHPDTKPDDSWLRSQHVEYLSYSHLY